MSRDAGQHGGVSTWTVVASAAAGAVWMYYFDPARGRYRRALVRDQGVHAARKLRTAFDTTSHDVRNRAMGAAATVRSWFVPTPASDPVLIERVHAKIGRIVSHPGSIEVAATDGIVTLSGPILRAEVPRLIDGVLDVPGVSGVVDRTEAYDSPDHVPGLQGGNAVLAGERGAFFRVNWPPTARLLGGAAGAAGVLYAARRRGAVSALLAPAAMLLLVRSATNLDIRRLFGIGDSRYAVDVQKSIHIEAPVDKVFGVWADFASFPRFMKHVRRVRPIAGDGQEARWRWTVRGPTGVDVHFDTHVTAYEANRIIGWQTDAGTPIEHAGRVYFRANPDGTTTVDVKMSYRPIGGAAGHALARLFRADPKHRLDDDLLRLKSYIETGKLPHDAAAATVPHVAAAPPAERAEPGVAH